MNIVPSFLAETFDKQVNKARLHAQSEYNDYWRTTPFKIGPCVTCGRSTKQEIGETRPDYFFDCKQCYIESCADSFAADLSDQMSVC